MISNFVYDLLLTELQDILPSILNQLGTYASLILQCLWHVQLWNFKGLILNASLSFLGPDNLDNLKKLAEQFQKQAPGAGAGDSDGAAAAAAPEDDDDDVPELVGGQTFEAAAEETHTHAS